MVVEMYEVWGRWMITPGGVRENCTGKLAKGIKADILLLSTNHLAFSPMNDPLSQLVYSAFPSAVDTTICDGKLLMKGRKVLVANSHLVVEKARELLEMKSKNKRYNYGHRIPFRR